MYAVFAEVDHKSLCSMAFSRLWESDQPLGQFVPAEMSVLPYSDPELFWYGPFRRPGTRRQPPADDNCGSAPADDMLALGDAAPESHAESEPEDVAGSGDEPSDEDEESDGDPDDLNEVLAALLASMVDEPEVRPARAESEPGPEPAATCEKAPHKADPQA